MFYYYLMNVNTIAKLLKYSLNSFRILISHIYV